MKAVLITGVGKGIGKALMERFLDDNFFVVGTYHTNKPEVVSDNIALVKLDLTKPKSLENCVHEIISTNNSL